MNVGAAPSGDGPAADPGAGSWVPGADGSGFPLQNLPYGACRLDRREFLGVRIGESVLDVRAAVDRGLFAELEDTVLDALAAPDLGPLLGLGSDAWAPVRTRLGELLVTGSASSGAASECLVPVGELTLGLPFPIADYVDFYSSIDHATNIGRMFRPDGDALLPNWRHLPVGYHGRAGTVVVSRTPITRPCGQRLVDGTVVVGPTEKLDLELEVGFVLGGRSTLGDPVPATAVRDHVFGVVLVNDWSARDIQSWEYVPLGPFLGKSFATSISAWVVPLDALLAFRVDGPTQTPEVASYLTRSEPWAFDIDLTVDLIPSGATTAEAVCEVGFAGTYWTVDQQLAHLTVNGASIRPGDLIASGTVSGPEPGQRGSLIEATWNGTEPLALGGVDRTFLHDGDEVVLRGQASAPGRPTVALGEVRGRVEPAR